MQKGIAGGGGGRWKEIDREAGKSQLVLLMTIRIVNDRGVAIIIFLSGGGCRVIRGLQDLRETLGPLSDGVK